MTQRIAVFPADRHSLYEEHGYSAAIRSGDLLFVSGQVGSHTDGTPEPDFQKQVRLAFENLKATLSAAGCTFDDIVDVTTFHTDPEQQLNDVMAVKQEIFALPPYPNSYFSVSIYLPFEKPLIRRLLYSRILQYTLAFQRVKINSINVVVIFTLLAI